jgi:SAM-dependent methyltransferase
MSTLDEVGRYYSEKLARHGASPRGVDWNGAESQELRFAQLLRVCEVPGSFSLNDIGCGYGALYDYLCGLGRQCDYLGVDISNAMIAKARELHLRARFTVGQRAERTADYTLASGIFNVRLSASDDAWLAHLLETLAAMDAGSRRGFAFNCLTKYSDAAMMQDYLYYADPCRLFDHCKTHFSKNVALLHDYGLYEFTILVRKG